MLVEEGGEGFFPSRASEAGSAAAATPERGGEDVSDEKAVGTPSYSVGVIRDLWHPRLQQLTHEAMKELLAVIMVWG